MVSSYHTTSTPLLHFKRILSLCLPGASGEDATYADIGKCSDATIHHPREMSAVMYYFTV